ncbi:sugar nucleotide-binding protein [Sediminibacillus albus]|uniref:dTDP-4-dehydrorhamnose reductase n=1 Tax=Sediminibacillus albus TaxID=407036 RepID=A0A1G8ZNY4_9BACI|nr:sugar nucleotide-binding protein [Sediminibacillus albus]SDK16768.1 dTDP-4-dehydrorhamnose reductase [Sediminibacillus albus]
MRISVFGADGYLGTSIYHLLKQEESNKVSGTCFREPRETEGMEHVDINQPEAFSLFYKKHQPDIVIWALMDMENEELLVAQGLTHVITHLTTQTKFIYLSSHDIFSEGEGPYNEDDHPKKLPEDNPKAAYTNAKIKAERIIQKQLNDYIILRTGPLYGKNRAGELDKRSLLLEESLAKGEPIEKSDDLIRTFTHIDDITTAIAELTKANLTGIFHAGPQQHVSYQSFYRKRAMELGYDPGMVKAQPEKALPSDIPMDTSLDSTQLSGLINTTFRSL